MADDSDLEKTEEATPQRLDKAREEGQIVRSKELVSLVMLATGTAGLWAWGSRMTQTLRETVQGGLRFDRAAAFESDPMMRQAGALLLHAAQALLPVLGALFLAALLAPLLLGGWTLSSSALVPKFSRLSPLAGIGRMFSTDMLAESVKTILKSVLIGTLAWWVLSPRLPALMDLMGAPVHSALPGVVQVVGISCALIVASLVGVAVLDAPYQIWNHHRNLRMTREEVRKEHKESDGDPLIKAQIRRQRQQMARRRMMAQVPQADIVVTNPTHYAVALKYDDGGTGAPRVVAKGADLVAQRIRELAQTHRIPVLQAPPLTRALFKHTELGQEIPVALYAAVAEVLAWAFQVGRQHAGSSLSKADWPEPRDLSVPADMDPLAGASAA